MMRALGLLFLSASAFRFGAFVKGLKFTNRCLSKPCTFLDHATCASSFDLDHDNFTDVIFGRDVLFRNDLIDLMFTLGDGKFVTWTIPTDRDGVVGVGAADLDGAGFADVVGAFSSAVFDDGWKIQGSLVWYTGDAPHTEHVIDESATFIRHIVVTDLDGDQDADIVASGSVSRSVANGLGSEAVATASTVWWYRNDQTTAGDGKKTSSWVRQTLLTGATPTRNFRVVDMDGDGHLDLLLAGWAGNTAAWAKNDGKQSFTVYNITGDLTTSFGSGARDAVAADFANDDGPLDVTISWSLSAMQWRQQVGPNNFVARHGPATDFRGYLLEAGDLDEDGFVDLVAVTGATRREGNEDVVWYRNDGNTPPSFTKGLVNPSLYPIDMLSVDVGFLLVADLDHDLDLDVIASDGTLGYRRYENRLRDPPPPLVDDATNFTVMTRMGCPLGSPYLTTKAECAAAAIELKAADPTVTQVYSQGTVGCYFDKGWSNRVTFEAFRSPVTSTPYSDTRFKSICRRRPSTYPYQLMSAGSCPILTHSFIETVDRCQQAARELGLRDFTASSNTVSTNPYGCYYKLSTNILYFGLTGGKRDTDTDRVSLCHFGDAPTTTTPTQQTRTGMITTNVANTNTAVTMETEATRPQVTEQTRTGMITTNVANANTAVTMNFSSWFSSVFHMILLVFTLT